jgi:NMD protein affecting ribosome stability and mRNA decay
MASNDFSGVSAALNASSYNQGQTMTLTVSGQNVHTGDPSTTNETLTITATIQSSSGATHNVSAQPVTVVSSTPGETTLEDVTIVSVVDSGGRTWTMAGRTATAVA